MEQLVDCEWVKTSGWLLERVISENVSSQNMSFQILSPLKGFVFRVSQRGLGFQPVRTLITSQAGRLSHVWGKHA